MNHDLVDALDSWDSHWRWAQDAAVTALKTAFPLLVEDSSRMCDHPRLGMTYEEGAGRVCVEDLRAVIEFKGLPNVVVEKAVDAVGFPYLNGADGTLVGSGPGVYSYDCEMSGAQFEFGLGADGRGTVEVCDAAIPDAVAVLDALRCVLESRPSGQGPGR
ncbi:hypothetical protein ACIQCR_16895 [Streptomyces sp. NPDC093249]|uniref:hypothetical protein n=1 Tax=unclassified Streptomyces TaxID=2593676 RepID=UPI003826F141